MFENLLIKWQGHSKLQQYEVQSYPSPLWAAIDHATLDLRCWWQVQPGPKCRCHIFFRRQLKPLQRVIEMNLLAVTVGDIYQK